jgi:FkbM family methyltransferase
MLARLICRLLGLAPTSLVEQLRRRPRVASTVDRAVSFLVRPLKGRAVAIRSGDAAGLLFQVPTASTIWLSGRVERPVQAMLGQLLRAGDVFFDVGAHLGFFTMLGARLVGPAGTAVAFEPHAASVDALRSNVELNGFTNVIVVPEAVSAETGTGFLVGRTAALTALVEADAEPGSGQPVRTTSIDDFVSAHPDLIPTVIKIDVEGHEVEVLRGMHGTLSGHQPVILCEMHGRNASFARMLREFGYTLRPLEGAGPVESVPAGAHIVAVGGRPT